MDVFCACSSEVCEQQVLLGIALCGFTLFCAAHEKWNGCILCVAQSSASSSCSWCSPSWRNRRVKWSAPTASSPSVTWPSVSPTWLSLGPHISMAGKQALVCMLFWCWFSWVFVCLFFGKQCLCLWKEAGPGFKELSWICCLIPTDKFFSWPVELLGYLWWWRKLYKAHHCIQITSLYFFYFFQTTWWVSSGAQVHPTSADPPDPQRHGEGQRSDQRAGLLHRGQRRPDRGACQALFPWTGQEGTLVRLSTVPFSPKLHAKSVGWDRRDLYPQGSMLFGLLPACLAVTVVSLKVSLISHNFHFFFFFPSPWLC